MLCKNRVPSGSPKKTGVMSNCAGAIFLPSSTSVMRAVCSPRISKGEKEDTSFAVSYARSSANALRGNGARCRCWAHAHSGSGTGHSNCAYRRHSINSLLVHKLPFSTSPSHPLSPLPPPLPPSLPRYLRPSSSWHGKRGYDVQVDEERVSMLFLVLLRRPCQHCHTRPSQSWSRLLWLSLPRTKGRPPCLLASCQNLVVPCV